MNAPPGHIRAAAVLFLFIGLGFGIPLLPAVPNLILHRELPLIFGFRAYGDGPFEHAGIKTTIPLLLAFLIVNALEVVAGVLLWDGARSGALLGLALIPFGAIFWWGFALPIPPIAALARAALLLVGWNALH